MLSAILESNESDPAIPHPDRRRRAGHRHTLHRYLLERGYQSAGIALSGVEAKALYQRESPDLILLDIRLGGDGAGVDFARFLQRQPQPCPFIYLTSQLDARTINHAQQTYPAGYLPKPVKKEELYAAIEIVRRLRPEPADDLITLQNRSGSYRVSKDNILYLQADHVRVRVHLRMVAGSYSAALCEIYWRSYPPTGLCGRTGVMP